MSLPFVPSFFCQFFSTNDLHQRVLSLSLVQESWILLPLVLSTVEQPAFLESQVFLERFNVWKAVREETSPVTKRERLIQFGWKGELTKKDSPKSFFKAPRKGTCVTRVPTLAEKLENLSMLKKAMTRYLDETMQSWDQKHR